MKKEEYKQMNQLDRIEFLLLKKELINTNSYTLSVFWFILITFFIILLFGTLEQGFYGTKYILDISPSILFILGIYLLITSCIDIIVIFKNFSNYEWINKHFQLNKQGGKTKWQS